MDVEQDVARVLYAHLGETTMRSSFAELARRITLGIGTIAACASGAFADDGDGGRRNLDRVFVIMMENHGFDQVVGPLQPNANSEQPNAPLLTPFITTLALAQGLQTFYFGVTIPAFPTTWRQLPAISSEFRTTTIAALQRR